VPGATICRWFASRVKEQWGKLTDDELDQIAGKRDQLVGKIQNSYAARRSSRCPAATRGAAPGQG